jgi:GxxExxY protein
MPYDDEDPPLVEPDPELNELSHRVIGAALEVYAQLGPGLDEILYRKALCREMELRGVRFQCEIWIDVMYKGEVIGRKRIDLLVGGRLIVELKAVEVLSPLHKAQLRTYLKVMDLRLGLLLNFNSTIFKEGIKRVLNPAARR